MTETFSLFWNGPYSQWYKSEFKVEGREFNCAEQAMMFGKANVFGDDDIAARVMAASHPSEQKKLGKKVKNFDIPTWNEVCMDIVYTANVEKFNQNAFLLKVLINDPADVLVEASPYDKIWGIGLSGTDPKALDRANWNGENRLGQVLTDVRFGFRNMSIDEKRWARGAKFLGDLEWLNLKQKYTN